MIGGLIAFVFLLIRSTMAPVDAGQATSAIVVSYYWHFVDVVWISFRHDLPDPLGTGVNSETLLRRLLDDASGATPAPAGSGPRPRGRGSAAGWPTSPAS